jgi:ribosome biogenesis GTPase
MTGIVIKVFGKFFTIEFNGQRYSSVLRGKMRRDKQLDIYSEAVAVGDIVEFKLGNEGTGAIEQVLKRKNVFTRKHKGGDRQDLIASNLDQLVVIQSFNKPRLNQRFVDRLLVRGNKEGIPQLLCVNKLDLAGDDDRKEIYSYYKGYDLDIIMVSAKTGERLEELKSRLSGKLSILIGNSGVGKTSILNSLYPGLDLETREISESTGKGRHTTTNVEMLCLEQNTRIVDTPGLREFGLADIEPHELGVYFMEFNRYAGYCGFSPCTHDHEPDCEVKRQVAEGSLSEERYISYLNILYSLKNDYNDRYRS